MQSESVTEMPKQAAQNTLLSRRDDELGTHQGIGAPFDASSENDNRAAKDKSVLITSNELES